MTRNVITYSSSTKAQNFEHLHKNNNSFDFNLQKSNAIYIESNCNIEAVYDRRMPASK